MTSIRELSSDNAVLEAIPEYDSRAIAGVTHAYQFGSASRFGDGGKGFSGGKAGAAKAFEDLGFTIVVRR